MKSKTVGAADLGHGWLKFIANGRTWRQPSVIGEPRQLFDDNIKTEDVQYKGSQNGKPVDYFVGDLALRHSKIKYAATADEKAKNWTTKIMLETGLGITASNSEILLVSGLPLNAFFKQKADLENLLQQVNFTAPYEVFEGNNRFICNPKIRATKIVPQPFGAAMDYLLNSDGTLCRTEDAKKKILVIDAGFYTMDLLILDAMQIDKRSHSPEGLGIDTAYQLIQDYLKEQLGKAPSRYDLDDYVRKGTYDGYDLQPLTERAFEALAAQTDLEVAQFNTKFDLYLVTGGWAPKLAGLLNLPKEKTIVYDQLGNVRGYGKIGRRTWRDLI